MTFTAAITTPGPDKPGEEITAVNATKKAPVSSENSRKHHSIRNNIFICEIFHNVYSFLCKTIEEVIKTKRDVDILYFINMLYGEIKGSRLFLNTWTILLYASPTLYLFL